MCSLISDDSEDSFIKLFIELTWKLAKISCIINLKPILISLLVVEKRVSFYQRLNEDSKSFILYF